MDAFPEPLSGLRGDQAAAASPRGLADRRELALVAVERTRMPMVVSDARQNELPIALANRAFLSLTGYEAEEVIGRNCRFLQGPETAPAAVDRIREGLRREEEFDVEILNYRKNGSAFWNKLHLSPIHDESGRLVYVFASQTDVTEPRKVAPLEAAQTELLREVDHRSMNVLAVVESIVRLSRTDNPDHYAGAVQRRVQALAGAHKILSERRWREIPLHQVLEVQMQPFGRDRIGLEGPQVLLPGDLIQPLALVLHELITNAATHGALARPTGTLHLRWSVEPDPLTLALEWIERGELKPALDRAVGFGTRIIKGIVDHQLKGRFRRRWEPEGLRAFLSIPLAA